MADISFRSPFSESEGVTCLRIFSLTGVKEFVAFPRTSKSESGNTTRLATLPDVDVTAEVLGSFEAEEMSVSAAELSPTFEGGT